MNSRASIEQFLISKRLALIGVSRNQADFSRRLMHDLQHRGYQVFPVNPAITEIDGQKCFQRAYELPQDVSAAIIMTRAESLPVIAKDCAIANFRNVWVLKSSGDRAIRQQGIKILNENLIDVIDGLCPYLFLEDSGMPHSFHRGVLRLFGNLPK